MTRLLALAVLLLAAAADAQTDRYVTTAAELAAAIAASQPGDTVTMANGTWTDTAISFDADGVEGDSITVRAETPGEVVLTGRSTLSIGGDYLKVDGLRFEGGKHVMFSYQWDCQSEVKSVREHFAKLGIPTWMDTDGGMQVDIYDSMARA